MSSYDGTPNPEARSGRYWKLTAERKKRIVDAVRAGNYVYAAVGMAGIGMSTYYDYLHKGKGLLEKAQAEGIVTPDIVEEARAFTELDRSRKNPIGEVLRGAGWPEHECLLVELVDELQRAEAEAELRLVTHWSKAAEQDWKAAMSLLSRRFPERWSEKYHVTQEVSGPDGAAIEVFTRSDAARTIAANPEARRLADDLLAKIVPPGLPGFDDGLLGELAGEDDAALPELIEGEPEQNAEA